MYFRYSVGAALALIGSIALAANSYLLGSGAIRWAHEHDPWERAALASGGAIVPWLLALWPLLFALVTVGAGLISRLGQRALLLMLWTVFFAYNFAMGTSNIATLREEKVAQIGHTADTVSDKKARKARLESQLAGIPQHRPAETVDRLLAAERANRRWTATAECADATAKASRDFCDAYRTLEGELAAARQADRLNADLDVLIADLASAPAATKDSADPFVIEVASATGQSERSVRVGLAMATPFILEVIGASCWKLSFLLFGWTLRSDEDGPGKAAVPVFNPAPLISPERARAAPAPSLEALTAQRKLAEWFFATCVRHAPAGALPEEDWYEHYEAVCKSSNDAPLPLESFRRIAARFVPRIQDIDGRTFYCEVLPLIPERAA